MSVHLKGDHVCGLAHPEFSTVPRHSRQAGNLLLEVWRGLPGEDDLPLVALVAVGDGVPLAVAAVDELSSAGRVDELADGGVTHAALHHEALEGLGAGDGDDGGAGGLGGGGTHGVGEPGVLRGRVVLGHHVAAGFRGRAGAVAVHEAHRRHQHHQS